MQEEVDIAAVEAVADDTAVVVVDIEAVVAESEKEKNSKHSRLKVS